MLKGKKRVPRSLGHLVNHLSNQVVMFHIDTNELQTIGSDIDETSSAQQFCSNSTFHLGHTTVYIFVGLMRRTAAVGTFQVTLPVYLINKNSICGSTCTKACEKQQYAEHPPKLENPGVQGGPP